MAPRESKVTPTKVQRVNAKINLSKKPATVPVVSKKILLASKNIQQTPIKGANTTQSQEQTNSMEPKSKGNKPATCPGSVTKSSKKSWKRRPKPAHSGVPVPEKMKKILQQQLEDSDCSF